MKYLIIFRFVLLFCLFLNELGIIFIYLIFKIVKYSEKDVLLRLYIKFCRMYRLIKN